MKYEIALDRDYPDGQRDKTSLGCSTGLLKKDLKVPYISHCLVIILYRSTMQIFLKTSQLI